MSEFGDKMVHDFFLLTSFLEIASYLTKASKIKLVEILLPLENRIMSSTKSERLICFPFLFIQKRVNKLFSDTLNNFLREKFNT